MARLFHVLEESINGEFWNQFKAEPFCAESMHRIAGVMWHTFNCHNLAEVFRARAVGGLEHPRFDAVCGQIDRVCADIHDLAWALIELDRCADWDSPCAKYFSGMVALTLEQLRKNDAMLFACIHQAACLLSDKITNSGEE